MNDQLQGYDVKTELKAGLAQCSEGQQLLFKRMYSHGNLDMPINDAVDNMDSDRLDWAMDQVRRTLEKKGESQSVWLKVCCPPPMKDRLAKYVKATGLTQAEILRRALTEFFERQERKSHG